MLKNQKGVGLLEVLVSVLILAVAILGFSAMQLRAVKATDETLLRSDAMIVIRNLSEQIRLYPTPYQKAIYKAKIAGTDVPTCDESKYGDCTTASETTITQNVKEAKDLAEMSGVTLDAIDCPGVATSNSKNVQKICLVAKWGKTTNTQGSDTKTSCLDTDGNYIAGATCFVMESY